MSGIGVSHTATHWLKQEKAHGGPPVALFIVQTWWPIKPSLEGPGEGTAR